jgi:hypothetical protein
VGFAIGWRIDDGGWDDVRAILGEHGPGSDLDLNYVVLEDMLVGELWFERDGRRMRPDRLADPDWQAFSPWGQRINPRASTPERTALAREYILPVAEFASQLAHGLDSKDFAHVPDGTFVRYSMTLDHLDIIFRKAGGRVYVLTSNLDDLGWALSFPVDEFIAAAHAFLRAFAQEIEREALGLLMWRSFAPRSTSPAGPST